MGVAGFGGGGELHRRHRDDALIGLRRLPAEAVIIESAPHVWQA